MPDTPYNYKLQVLGFAFELALNSTGSTWHTTYLLMVEFSDNASRKWVY